MILCMTDCSCVFVYGEFNRTSFFTASFLDTVSHTSISFTY